MAFDVDLQDLENNIPQSAWEMVTPNMGQDDTITHLQGFSTLQNEEKEKEDTIDTVCDDNTRNKGIHCICCMQKQLKSKT